MLDAREYIINKANIALPEDFLKRWLYSVNEGKFTMEEIEKDFPLFIKDFKWQTVANKIMADNNLKITEEAVKEQARRLAQYQFAMYGMQNVPEEHLENFSQMILKDEKQSRRLIEKAEETIVLDFVRNTVTLENKEVSAEELRNMNN
jgi:trigger factor